MTARRLLRRRAAPDELAGAQDMPGPPAVEITARHVRVGDDYAATLGPQGREGIVRTHRGAARRERWHRDPAVLAHP